MTSHHSSHSHFKRDIVKVFEAGVHHSAPEWASEVLDKRSELARELDGYQGETVI